MKVKTNSELITDFQKLDTKIWKFVEARRIAESAFEKLKEDSENWKRMCELYNMNPNSDFGDWTC